MKKIGTIFCIRKTLGGFSFMKLIAQGAEAKIYLEKDQIVKERIKKDYRIDLIDKRLRKFRTKAEAKLLSKASRSKVDTPQVIDVDLKNHKLVLEYIDGTKFRDWLDNETDKELIKKVCKLFGKQTKRLHNSDIIHGDLTTSNIIKKEDKLYFIDFGLSSVSIKIEDKAVDLHLLKECFVSKHYDIYQLCWKAFKDGYKDKKVLDQLKKVEARGKYKKLG